MQNPLAWYIAGPLIGLIVPLLLLLREKQFGISSSYRHLWSIINDKIPYFNYDSNTDKWQFHFTLGLLIMGGIYSFSEPNLVANLASGSQYKTLDFYELNYGFHFLFGGLFIGFGSRYANGCTAGHCIMGLSQFSLASLIATLGFFTGGLLVAYVLNPFLLS